MKMSYLIAAFIIGLIFAGSLQAQTPYYTRLDSVGAAAVTGETDSLATIRPGKTAVWLGITITNSTVGDTLKARGKWYGNTSAYKTLSWRNTKNGSIDSVLIIPATSRLPQTWELVDSNIDELQIYSSAGTYSATRKSKVYFRYRWR